ncbi:hypothetical protein IFM58399_05657 [Aspergillus lentulus]|uniref:DUF2985 domain-containing protein n=1 Tax=Aspergillus lentulus TaxID=293939 RepID=UPI0013945859|nr:uncharacterized protein IFM58399_05657 [Aspergillus lentulus]GFF39655.1 hypothetical protein IFM58399_05657 [Aspergillus lentulus]GFF61389.1 hypothetical protein IFM62136_04996 [Aspergillus lentulus]GFF74733.1 hypothetical protein IFM47457_03717 [Aspergillus lentulus]GFG09638.1 hypothetical protein IFM61392_05989 [Aspergillus lentulus]
MNQRAWLTQTWRWITTPKGFFITIYGLNIVAWGGMLFLLICNAAPAMCHPSCNDRYSSRRIWIEITSQILNGLFCVTGFGLAPWRFRDLYWWCCWRMSGRDREKSLAGIARLASIHQAWYRLPIVVSCFGCDGDCGCEQIKSATTEALDISINGARAPATATWKMDFVVWCNIWNTILQGCLAGCMWGMNRFNRPSWTTGLFVALACVVAGAAGCIVFRETRRVAGSMEAKTTDSAVAEKGENCV